MVTRHRIFNKHLITAAVTAAVTFQTLNPNSTNSPFINSIIRSTRALTTIISTIIDYKYTLSCFNLSTDEYRLALTELHLRSAKRILKMCEANKGIYIKAGQFVSGVKQVPKEYSTLLSSLQDQSVPYKFEVIEHVMNNNFGPNSLSEVFLSFDEEPIAAASIAQVHRAVLRNDQDVAVEVAVKVQYPGLKFQMKFDVLTMSLLSKFVGWSFPGYRFQWIVSEFEKSIASELDFIVEGKNLERIRENFKDNSMVKVPNVFWDFTTRQVLTMEFCGGRKVDDLDFMKQRGISEVKVAKTLAEVVAEMIFVHGFVHGDLHPGNILVSPERKNGFCLVLLDFGVCKQLDEDFRLKYCELWEALVVMDSNKIQEIGEYFGVGRYSRYFPVIFTGRTIDSKSSIGRGMSVEEKKNLKQELKSLKMDDISSFMESLPTDFLTVLRTDGLLRSLISKFGAPVTVRLLAYAEYALYGLSLKADSISDSALGVMLFRFKIGLRYVQVRLLFGILGLVSWLESIKHTSTRRLKDLLASAGYVVRNLYRPLLIA
ncbi:putative 65-kDa microtubule-associated protein 6-like [Capsicum annuum]|uniref:Protein kinase domain-containing protein n=1 Tax=Capsicum annuum TaxID=4072 RepID=A0A1U8GUX0_CAPAN|nr:aarF domain-containing protein kinase 1 [Capsicum annuum]KAF3667301.1 putative 65-kDa microtubule-associated protein 6-like [Capsicum annuum]KAF3669599.1 putative 65-kDa microtubule-associated protein 6-like [Capsicum annuum]PHT81279.1 hypothetical protein T459_14294 [Capsicum annuum]